MSGSIRWDQNTDDITADIRLRQDGKQIWQLDIAWNDRPKNAVATLTGTINEARVKAKRIAP